MKIIAGILKRIDYRPNFMTVAIFVSAVLLYCFRNDMPEEYFYEDRLIENIQLLILAIAAIIAWRSDNNRNLFVFVALVMVFMIFRETNMFRKWICYLVYDSEHSCKLRDMGYYGYAIRGFSIGYVLYMLWYFIRHKVWQPLWQYAKKAPIYIWDLLILISSAFLGTLAEKDFWYSTTAEECFELIFYLSALNCILRYRKVAV